MHLTVGAIFGGAVVIAMAAWWIVLKVIGVRTGPEGNDGFGGESGGGDSSGFDGGFGSDAGGGGGDGGGH